METTIMELSLDESKSLNGGNVAYDIGYFLGHMWAANVDFYRGILDQF